MAVNQKKSFVFHHMWSVKTLPPPREAIGAKFVFYLCGL